MEITDDEFPLLWQEISEAVVRIAMQLAKQYEWQKVYHLVSKRNVFMTYCSTQKLILIAWMKSTSHLMNQWCLRISKMILVTIVTPLLTGYTGIIDQEHISDITWSILIRLQRQTDKEPILPEEELTICLYWLGIGDHYIIQLYAILDFMKNLLKRQLKRLVIAKYFL